MRAALIAVFAASALAAPAAATTQEVGGMPATHAEWDQVDANGGQTVPQVRNIIGSPGDEGGHGANNIYHIDFKLAWRDDKVGRVQFSELSDLSIDKNIVAP